MSSSTGSSIENLALAESLESMNRSMKLPLSTHPFPAPSVILLLYSAADRLTLRASD